MLHSRISLRIACMGFIIACVGCSSEVNRRELSGTVTVGGTPVPSGVIYFEPDDKQGNIGPQAVADITAGKYRTRPEFGVVKGPHIVRVIVNPTGDFDPGKPLPAGSIVGEHLSATDIAADAKTINLDLPARKK